MMKPGQDLQLRSVVFGGQDQRTRDEIERLCVLAGVDFSHETNENSTVEGILRLDADPAAPFVVTARFHDLFAPYFALGQLRLHVRDDAADVLELIVAVGATMRGTVIGFVGAHGGAGVSTLSAWVARVIAGRGESVTLIDLNATSHGIDRRLGIEDEPGLRWPDLGGRGALLSGQIIDRLPMWKGVRVVSADNRGAVQLGGDVDQGARVIAAASQVSTWTFIDLGVAGQCDQQRDWMEWCDAVVIVHGADAVSLHSARGVHENVTSRVPLMDVGVGVGSKNEAAHSAQVVGCDEVLPIRQLKGMRSDIDHGVTPGDRANSGAARDIKRLVARLRDIDV